MDRKIKCEYLNDENLCRAVIENEDGKAVRKDSCANESLEACCYFCKSRSSCDISCNYLGDQMVVRTEIQNGESEAEPEEKHLQEFNGEYLGGHPAFPKRQSVRLILGRESLVIPEFELSIPCLSLKRIENMTRDKISAARVVFLGVVGALWKKEQQYMVLTYRDKYAGNNLSLVFKMPHLEDVQPFIYNKMIEGRRKNKNEA